MEEDSSDNFNSESDSLPSVLNYNRTELSTDDFAKNLEVLIIEDRDHVQEIEVMKALHNMITSIPKNLYIFTNLRKLNLTNNRITHLPDIFKHLQLSSLVLSHNHLTNESLPKKFTACKSLREINFTSNRLTVFPEQVLEFKNLRYLYLGSNKIKNIPKNISKLTNLRLLHIYKNEVETIPESIADLRHLKAIRLHENMIKMLPTQIVTLKNLTVLSLRENPLINRFISDMSHQPASLLELSARTVKLHSIPVNHGDVPESLLEYMNTAHRCVNPRCRGVFFDTRVEHVKFVDFCGKYKLPLLRYLCSSKCVGGEDGFEEDLQRNAEMMKKVLLG